MAITTASDSFTYDSPRGDTKRPADLMANIPRGDYLLDVGFGLVPNRRRAAALGHNADVDAPEDVWTGGGDYPWMTAATALEIVSDSAADASAGTGARTVTINGLDAAWAEVAQTVTLNGTTAVAIPTSLYRIQSIIVVSAGTGKTNAGTLTVRDVSGATLRGQIAPAISISQQSQFTVPAGMTLSVNSIVLSINRPSSTRDAAVATFFQTSTGVQRLPLELTVDGNTYLHWGLPGIIVPEKTDFGLRCTAVSAINTDLTAAWLGVLKTA